MNFAKILKNKKAMTILVALLITTVFLGITIVMQESGEFSILSRGTGSIPNINIVHSETIDHDVGGVTTYTMYIIIYVTDGDEVDLNNDEIIDFSGDVIEIKSEYSRAPPKDQERVWNPLDLTTTTNPTADNNPFVKNYTFDFTDSSSSLSIRVYATDDGGNQVFERQDFSVMKSGNLISFDIILLVILPVVYLIRKKKTKENKRMK